MATEFYVACNNDTENKGHVNVKRNRALFCSVAFLGAVSGPFSQPNVLISAKLFADFKHRWCTVYAQASSLNFLSVGFHNGNKKKYNLL